MRKKVKLFKALSDQNRVRIIKMLEEREMCVCEMTVVLELATSTVSKHLSILRDAGLVIDRKEGKWVNYSLNIDNDDEDSDEILFYIRNILNEDKLVEDDKSKVVGTNRDELCK